MGEGPQTAAAGGLDPGRVLMTGAAITGSGAILGLIVGALASGAGGFWMFVGMGVGAVIAVCVLGLVVIRSL